MTEQDGINELKYECGSLYYRSNIIYIFGSLSGDVRVM